MRDLSGAGMQTPDCDPSRHGASQKCQYPVARVWADGSMRSCGLTLNSALHAHRSLLNILLHDEGFICSRFIDVQSQLLRTQSRHHSVIVLL